LKIVVLFGGSSEERAVSLASGAQVAAALRSRGHEVVSVDTARGRVTLEDERAIFDSGIGVAGDVVGSTPKSGEWELPDAQVILSEPALRNADVIFLALHGGAGEDGTVQTLLEVAGFPYVGSGPLACAVTMDKDFSKRLLRDGGVSTPPWISGDAEGGIVAVKLGLPVIVKPQSGGSSVRLTLARSVEEIDRATEDALGGGDVVMYEAYVDGREFTVGVIDGETMPVIEIIPENELFDYECKYKTGMAQEIVPAPISATLVERLQTTALLAHEILGLEQFSRIDFIVDSDDKLWCLEANALPGLTGNSLLPKAAKAAGMDVGQLCERIARLGTERGVRRRNS